MDISKSKTSSSDSTDSTIGMADGASVVALSAALELSMGLSSGSQSVVRVLLLLPYFIV